MSKLKRVRRLMVFLMDQPQIFYSPEITDQSIDFTFEEPI